MKFVKIISCCMMLLALVSCANNNIHEPDTELLITEYKYAGTLESTVPLFPFFEGVVSKEFVTVTACENNTFDIWLDAFSISIPMMDKGIEIGQMKITGLKAISSGGNYLIEPTEFECQGGEYWVRGTIQGYFSKEEALITLNYKPGSMPFEVKSIFKYHSHEE